MNNKRTYSNAFFVPIDVQTLVVDAQSKGLKNEFAGQLVDFSQLPHVKKGDHCSPPRIRPNISEDLVSKPFESTNDPLELGVHLHWTLPPEFRRARATDPGGISDSAQLKPRFREVPNRWLIERRIFEPNTSNRAMFNGKTIKPKTWLLEADALSAKKEKGSCAFPTEPEQFGYPGYKYIGKVYEYQSEYPVPRTKEEIEKDPIKYLKQLTALGYGEPLFSAYYPECRNVFGFHDDLSFQVEGDTKKHFSNKAISGLTYELRYIVTGWYEDIRKDPMTKANFHVWENLLTEVQKIATPEGVHPLKHRLLPFGLLPEIDHGPDDTPEQFFWLVNLGHKASVNPTEQFTDAELENAGNSWGVNETVIYRTRLESWDRLFQKYAVQNYAKQNLPPSERAIIKYDEKLNTLIRGRSVLIGRVAKVIWNGKGDGGADYTHKSSMDAATVVVANTPGQALSALLAKNRQDELALDALQLGLFSQQDQQDFPAILETGLHESAFEAVSGGNFWTIRLLSNQTDDSSLDPPGNPATAVPDIPSAWALKLQFINTVQNNLNRQQFQLASQQGQYYADWYKYLLMQYDYTLNKITSDAHVNHVREYLAKEVYAFGYLARELKQYAIDVRDSVGELEELIQQWNENPANRNRNFQLSRVPAPRFWQPREPTILLHGSDAVPSQPYPNRTHRTFVELYVALFESAQTPIPNKILEFTSENYWENVDSWRIENASTFPRPSDGSKDSWSPLYMEWKVEVFPITKPGDKDFNQKDWPLDSIVAHYDLPKRQPDLRLQDNLTSENKVYKDWLENNTDIQIQAGKRLQTFEGRSILTGGAHRPLFENLEKLIEQVLDEEKDKEKLKNFRELVRKYKDLPILSQALSGFNDALLMRKQVLQLPVKDPLAKTDILHRFAEEIAESIGGYNDVAPLPSNLFLPLREGPLRIRQLRLVDVWGRTKTLDVNELKDRVVVASPMQPPPGIQTLNASKEQVKGMAFLPPRIVQPIRLNFRWISAERGEEESGQFSADSPICGYLVPNFLDNSIHFFNASGKGLAVLARSGEKLVVNPFPGEYDVREKSFNLHLWQFLQSVKTHGIDYLSELLQSARNSMAATQPGNYAIFDGTPLLMGRPLALVRAKLKLELRGQPAVNNSWTAREAVYMNKEHKSNTLGFEKLRFAVRVGNAFQVEDGCLAYFLDQGDGKVNELFSDYVNKPGKNTEGYWNQLAHLRKWKEIFEERESNRQQQIDNLAVQIKGLENRKLQPLQPEVLNQIEAQLADRKFRYEQLEKEKEAATSEKNIHGDAIQKLLNEMGFQSDTSVPGLYKPHSDLLTLSLEEVPLTIGILMDPRAAIHLSTGILPVKSINIPAEQFADALNRIQIAFLTTPIISPRPVQLPDTGVSALNDDETVPRKQSLFLTTPQMAGYKWAWWQHTSRNVWTEIPPEQIQQPPAGFLDDFTPQAIYEGWMKLLPEDK